LAETIAENIFKNALERESIFLDRNVVTPHFTPAKLPFREKQINEITSVLSSALQGKKADNLFIYGKTGTGKTATSKFVLQQLGDFVKKNNSFVETSYINCRNYNSKYKTMVKLVKKFFPEENFVGYSNTFIYEKLLEYVGKGIELIIVLDEIDKVKDLDELVYCLTRANDELEKGSISVIGISNNLLFKDRLDPRTKSSLCEKELVFPPYNAQELKAILSERCARAFKPGAVEDSAISLASAFAAQESGDARTAVMLMLRAGELADKMKLQKISDEQVKEAKNLVEEEIIFNMISTLPRHEQLVLYSISFLTSNKKGVRTITNAKEEGVLFSGEVYDEYLRISKGLKDDPVSSRWYRQYLNELEMYGLILSTASGKGIRGNTRLIKLGFDAEKIKAVLEKEIMS